MACCTEKHGSILADLQDLVKQIGDSDNHETRQPCGVPCCTPCTSPYAEVIMTCPPPILAPTRPQPVKPLQLPCVPNPCHGPPPLTPEELENSRFDNFYNNYNIDWHSSGKSQSKVEPNYKKNSRVCSEDHPDEGRGPAPGCPTGFKPCTMKLTPSSGCSPYGVWCAQIQPCPPKPKKKSKLYEPGPCSRPCCKHWEPKEGPCLYDDPCKAHCFNHPPGIKPSGRWP